MAANPCRTKELDHALDAARVAWERHVRARLEVRALVGGMRRGVDPGAPTAAILDELVERCAELAVAVDGGVRVGPAMAGVGAAVALVTEVDTADAALGTTQDRKSGQLQVLVRRLESTARGFVSRREQARAPFEAYWECTERMRPRRAELLIETEGVMNAGMASARLRRSWTARVSLMPKASEGRDSFVGRFARWLADPSLPQELTGDAVVTATMPAFEWTPARRDVEVKAAEPVSSGGPLRARFAVSWHRGDPGYAMAAVSCSGEQSVTLHVQLTVQGVASQFGGEQALHDLLRQQLLSHQIGAKSIAAQWDPVQLRHAYQSRRTSASEQTHCRVWLHPAPRYSSG